MDRLEAGTDQHHGVAPRRGANRTARVPLVSLLELVTGPKRLLIVDGAGLAVGKHSERLRVMAQREVIQELPLLDLEHVLVVGRGISFSSDVVAVCAERGIAIDFVSERDETQASLLPIGGPTVQTRRQQLVAYGDGRGAHLARSFAGGKMRNQARLLRYLVKNRRESMPQAYRAASAAALTIERQARLTAALDGANADAVRQGILTLEGHASKSYWQAARDLLLADVTWDGRETQGATDPVNSALNYAYKILFTHVQRAIVLAGLDPYGGFLHADRPGKPSLVLDMMEEFRQMVVDRCIFALFNQRVHIETEDGWLTPASRRTIVERIEDRLEGIERYEGKRQTVRYIIYSQARHMAAYLRSERADYRPFVGRW